MKDCPACNELLVFPRNSYCYCEDCGWPDEDSEEKYSYPKDGQKMEAYQPNLEFFSTNKGWVPSGVIFATMRHADMRGLYRYPTEMDNKKYTNNL